MPATDGLSPLRLPVGMIGSGWICSTDSPFARRRRTVWSMSSVMTGGRPPYFPLRAAVSSPSSVDLRMFSLGLGHRGEEAEQQLAGSDPDVRARQVGVDRRGDRLAGPPRLSGPRGAVLGRAGLRVVRSE
ncbi:hypothetical protein [Embleya scabrispora]|uniref:hypothetical protein n=1 Tax=Embleya scabrispora TaxID=159449 RepID=UPI001375019C|nr:hypothetical protein [Embleya scabrispora]